MRLLLAQLAELQGVAGVALLGAGAYLIAGLGWGLVVLGAAFLTNAAVG